MLDNFRRRDVPQSTRLQSPYNRLQEALSSAGAEPAKPEAFGIEASKADLRDDPEPTRSGRESVSKLIVGPDIKLKGAEITDCDTLVVEGRVEASMDSRVIQIAEHGVFVGKAGIDVAEIRGRFEGELTARKQLVIRATGKVSGKGPLRESRDRGRRRDLRRHRGAPRGERRGRLARSRRSGP